MFLVVSTAPLLTSSFQEVNKGAACKELIVLMMVWF